MQSQGGGGPLHGRRSPVQYPRVPLHPPGVLWGARAVGVRFSAPVGYADGMGHDPSAPPEQLQPLITTIQDLYWTLRQFWERAIVTVPLPLSEIEVLRYINRHPGCSVSDIARDLALQHSNVSVTLRSLVARDLVIRQPDAQDRRTVRLSPSPAAVTTRADIDAAWVGALGPFLDRLSQDEMQTLLDAQPLLRRLANLRPPPLPAPPQADPARD